jgi:hypothetical protein
MVEKPKAKSSLAEQELDRAEKQLEVFEKNVNDLTLDRMNMAPKQDVEPQTKIAQRDLDKSKETYLKPVRAIGSREKFNEDYRQEYEYAKQYVNFIAENKEIIGESIELWTKPFAGLPAENWKVPVNKPVWGPRYLAEQIKRASYHVLTMQQSVTTGADGMGQYYGGLVVDSVKQRLDAIPVSSKKSIFMGASNFG